MWSWSCELSEREGGREEGRGKDGRGVLDLSGMSELSGMSDFNGLERLRDLIFRDSRVEM